MNNGFIDSLIDHRSRYAWKYACSRGITGTPQFLINGVQVPDASGFNPQEWKKFLDDLLNEP